MQSFTVDKLDLSQYSPGLNFTSLDRKPVFDMDGNVRWYSSQKSFEVFTRLKNGRYLFTYSVAGVEGDVMMEQDLLGKIYAIYNVADGVHHDVYELPTGNLLVTSSDLKSNTNEDYILELDRTNGHIVRSIDLKNTLDPGRPHQVTGLATNDWLHLNSIVYDTADHSIIISSKAQSAVVKLTYPGMQIKWILGPHDNWSQKYQPYLLTPVGANLKWPWSQHHATLYAPDVPGAASTDILLFDNALFRSFDNPDAVSSSDQYSRVVHYRINAASMTIEQVWEYGQALGPALFSPTGGSAYRLSNGDVLGTWGIFPWIPREIYRSAVIAIIWWIAKYWSSIRSETHWYLKSACLRRRFIAPCGLGCMKDIRNKTPTFRRLWTILPDTTWSTAASLPGGTCSALPLLRCWHGLKVSINSFSQRSSK